MTAKFFTRKELEKLIDENHESVRFVKRKKTTNSSRMWEHFHQIFISNIQQQFVSCNECKAILAYASSSGTNNLKTHLTSCSQTKTNALNQTTVHDYYLSSKEIKIPTKIKLSVIQACAEFSTLDGRAFETMAGKGFQNLAQVLFDAGRSLKNSSIQIQNILSHPTIVRKITF